MQPRLPPSKQPKTARDYSALRRTHLTKSVASSLVNARPSPNLKRRPRSPSLPLEKKAAVNPLWPAQGNTSSRAAIRVRKSLAPKGSISPISFPSIRVLIGIS